MNSDTMIICVLNHNERTIKLCSIYRDTYLNILEDLNGNPDCYTKANSAYAVGGPTQFLSMLNYNLDLSITEYMTVNFLALAETVDLLGGLDIEMTREEVVHLNNYNVETSQVCGVPYEEIQLPPESEFDGAMMRTFHCNGSQSVSYARIRYTSGNDFRRASRQREVLKLIKEKASTADLGTLDAILNAVLPDVTTNIDNMKLITLATKVDDSIFALAGASKSAQGTGGMITKLQAAKICMDCGCEMVIANGNRPDNLYDIMDGKSVGTKFTEKAYE